MCKQLPLVRALAAFPVPVPALCVLCVLCRLCSLNRKKSAMFLQFYRCSGHQEQFSTVFLIFWAQHLDFYSILGTLACPGQRRGGSGGRGRLCGGLRASKLKKIIKKCQKSLKNTKYMFIFFLGVIFGEQKSPCGNRVP